MSLSDLWRAPLRAGRRLVRVDLILIPLAVVLFVLTWHFIVVWREYPSFFLPGPRPLPTVRPMNTAAATTSAAGDAVLDPGGREWLGCRLRG